MFRRPAAITCIPKYPSLIHTQKGIFLRSINTMASKQTSSLPSHPPPPTFSNQSKLPRLPIPPLEATAEKYLKTLKPLLTDQEFHHSEKAVKEFIKPGGLGHELQKRLIEHDKHEPYSWLERWWLRLAYHSWREPELINVNWWLLGMNKPYHPKELLKVGGDATKKGTFTKYQIQRAAGLINNYLNYKEALDK